jgi:hypothetical protein
VPPLCNDNWLLWLSPKVVASFFRTIILTSPFRTLTLLLHKPLNGTSGSGSSLCLQGCFSLQQTSVAFSKLQVGSRVWDAGRGASTRSQRRIILSHPEIRFRVSRSVSLYRSPVLNPVARSTFDLSPRQVSGKPVEEKLAKRSRQLWLPATVTLTTLGLTAYVPRCSARYTPIGTSAHRMSKRLETLSRRAGFLGRTSSSPRRYADLPGLDFPDD